MSKIGPYEILEILHQGAQSLYRAKAKDGRVVAVKTIPVANLTEEMRERFKREAEISRTLEHPNLIRVFETGEADGMLYQAMELLEGSDLGKVMAAGQSFSWEDKLSIMEQICDGLQYAHDHKLVHRDIKPANLFLENSGHVRVLDFGMVRVAESELTKVGSSVGTLNYMAPEQIRGERCTPASDVFSTGIVFYQLSTGRHPFSNKDRSLVQVVSAIVFETPVKLGEICPDAPEGLEFILNKAMEKDPGKRLQNAGDLKQALSLCRITMKLGASQSQSSPRQTPASEPRPLSQPSESITPQTNTDPDDPQKTKVLKRPAGTLSTPKPAPPPPPPPAPAPRVVAEPKLAPGFRYCPICTTPNQPGAVMCRGCGNPLGPVKAAPTSSTSEKPVPWGLYIAIGLAVVLAIALIVVLIERK